MRSLSFSSRAEEMMLQDLASLPLVELDLQSSILSSESAGILTHAVCGGTLCSTTIQRLKLRSCCLTTVALNTFAQVLASNSLPNLIYLDI